MKQQKPDTRSIGRDIFKLIGGRKFAIKVHAEHFRAKNTKLSFVLQSDFHDQSLDGNYVEIYYNKDVNRYDIKYIKLDPDDRSSTLLNYVMNVKEQYVVSTFSNMTNLYGIA